MKFKSGTKDSYGKVVPPTAICGIYSGIQITGMAAVGSTSFVIIAINLILKKQVIKLISWVK